MQKPFSERYVIQHLIIYNHTKILLGFCEHTILLKYENNVLCNLSNKKIIPQLDILNDNSILNILLINNGV